MSAVLVSVIIPCFNAAETICHALDSIAAQTCPVHQVICVDDASTDHTHSVIANWQADHPNVALQILRLTTNAGPSAARNLGWQMATGEYIAFLDADDAWHPQKIALQSAWMRAHPQVDLCGHTHLFAEQTNLAALPHLSGARAYTITPDQIVISNPFVTPSVMLKRELPERFDARRRYTEDYLLWMQICLNGHPVVMLDLPLVLVSRSDTRTKLSQNYLRMRLGDMQNYWHLWRAGKLRFSRMIFLVPFSLMKFLLMLTLPSAHTAIKRRMYALPLPEDE